MMRWYVTNGILLAIALYWLYLVWQLATGVKLLISETSLLGSFADVLALGCVLGLCIANFLFPPGKVKGD